MTEANRIEQAYSVNPIEILGFDGVPQAGDPFQVTSDDKAGPTSRDQAPRTETS